MLAPNNKGKQVNSTKVGANQGRKYRAKPDEGQEVLIARPLLIKDSKTSTRKYCEESTNCEGLLSICYRLMDR